MAANRIFGSGTIKIGLTASPTDQFECQISNWTATATAQSVTVPATYCQGASQAATPSAWSVSFDFAQDWGSSPSLSELLHTNDGELLYWTFEPDDIATAKFDGRCYAVAGDIGGAGQDLWVSTGSMPMPEAPTYTPSP